MTKTDLDFAVVDSLAKLLLAFTVTGINAAVLYTVLRTGFPEASKDVVIGIVSAAGTMQGIVLQYYFGSSSGSAAKDRAKAP